MYLPDTYGTANMGDWAQQLKDYAKVLLELLRMFRLDVSLEATNRCLQYSFLRGYLIMFLDLRVSSVGPCWWAALT